jgi:hypothetical protein
MEELLLNLEKRIKLLVQNYEELNNSHQKLQQSKKLISMEKEILLSKQRKTMDQIEHIINRLKNSRAESQAPETT